MGKDSEDDEKVEIERVAESPNIETDSNDIDGLRNAISSSSQQSEIDKKAEQIPCVLPFFSKKKK